MQYRLMVEVEYLIALGKEKQIKDNPNKFTVSVQVIDLIILAKL